MPPSSLPNLEDRFIDETYDGLLHTASESLSSSDLKRIYDGSGNPIPMSISKDAVTIGLKVVGGIESLGTVNLGTVSYALSANVEGSVLTYENGTTSFQSLLDSVYPVGSVYFSVNDTDPSNLFRGFWRRIGEGRFIAGVGQGDDGTTQKNIESRESIGKYEHTLTIAEIPNHNHDVGGNSERFGRTNSARKLSVGSILTAPKGITSFVGGDAPHNNTPPSFGLYVWERIS
jgi:hypothetical protein